jgi:hypothetical protein
MKRFHHRVIQRYHPSYFGNPIKRIYCSQIHNESNNQDDKLLYETLGKTYNLSNLALGATLITAATIDNLVPFSSLTISLIGSGITMLGGYGVNKFNKMYDFGKFRYAQDQKSRYLSYCGLIFGMGCVLNPIIYTFHAPYTFVISSMTLLASKYSLTKTKQLGEHIAPFIGFSSGLITTGLISLVFFPVIWPNMATQILENYYVAGSLATSIFVLMQNTFCVIKNYKNRIIDPLGSSTQPYLLLISSLKKGYLIVKNKLIK